jgi:hypothetical protein
VPIVNDSEAYEGDEYFNILLSGAVNAGIGNSTSRVVIHDNEGPYLSVSEPLVDPTEGGGATFKVTLSVPHDNTVTVHYRTVAVTASRSDFTSKVSDYSNYLVFDPTPPDATTPQTANVTIGTASDSIYENWWEYFELEIFDPSGASISDPRAYAYVYDNEAEPTVIVGIRTVTEGDAYAAFTMTLTRPSAFTSRFYWSADGGGAAPRAGPDLRDASGCRFPPRETTHDVTVELFEDAVDEPNETYYVDLDTSTAVGAIVGSAAASARSPTTTPARSRSATPPSWRATRGR